MEILIFILSFVLLWWAGGALVRSLVYLARYLGVSEYVLSFILMSFATSVPELFIGISSAVQDVPRLSLGNVLGANLINITLLVGLATVLAGGIKVGSKISRGNFLLVVILAFLPLVLGADGLISRADGLVLIGAFTFYAYRLLSDSGYFSRYVNGIPSTAAALGRAFGHMRGFILGVAALLVSSVLIIWSGKAIAADLGMGNLMFGLLFVAVGTTLPELVFTIKSSGMRHPDLSLGNALGSVAFNATLIVGLVALISPISVSLSGAPLIAAGLLLAGLVLFNFFIYTRSRLSTLEGWVLIFLYVVFLITQII